MFYYYSKVIRCILKSCSIFLSGNPSCGVCVCIVTHRVSSLHVCISLKKIHITQREKLWNGYWIAVFPWWHADVGGSFYKWKFSLLTRWRLLFVLQGEEGMKIIFQITTKPGVRLWHMLGRSPVLRGFFLFSLEKIVYYW